MSSYVLSLTILFLTSIKVYGYSACDVLDLILLVDSGYLYYNNNNFTDFVLDVAYNGSNEYTGFSIVLYGDYVPSNINPMILSLSETYDIKEKDEESEYLRQQLNITTEAIHNAISFNDTVTLEYGFQVAYGQDKPNRTAIFDSYSKYNEYNSIYVIFDYDYGVLISDDGINTTHNSTWNETCLLFDYDLSHEYTQFHFILNEKPDSVWLECNGSYPNDQINSNTFYFFNEIQDKNGTNNTLLMKKIYNSVSCPAKIIDGNNSLELSNNVQFIDPSTIRKCTYIYDETSEAIKLNSASSIIIENYYNSGNTFKKGDILLVSNDSYAEFSSINGCEGQYVFKIIEIYRFDDLVSADLAIEIPKSPFEYIFKMNVPNYNVSVTNTTMNITNTTYSPTNVPTTSPISNDNSTRRRLSFLSLSDSLSIPIIEYGYWDSFELSKEGTYETSTGKDKVTFSGTGSITLEYSYEAYIYLYLNLNFEWDILDGDIDIDMNINGGFELNAYFMAEIVGQLTIDMEELLRFTPKKPYIFWIGYVPVVYKPFIQLDASVETVPLVLYAGIKCGYGQGYKLGYYYKQDTTFQPEYGLLRTNRRFKFSALKTWYDVQTTDECSILNYAYGVGAGLTCVWFDYNSNTKKCSCRGAGIMIGDLKTESGTNAYIMNKECNSYGNQCAGCGSKIWIQRDEEFSSSCPFYTDKWYCAECKLFQDNSGYAIVTTDQNFYQEKYETAPFCQRFFGIGDPEDECPGFNQEFGFDVNIGIRLGVILYEFIQLYIKPQIEIPFRLNIPEKDLSICGSSYNMYNDHCELDKQLISFTVAMDLAFYIGFDFEIDGFLDAILEQADDISDGFISENEMQIGNSITLIDRTLLGECMELTGSAELNYFNSLINDICCSTDNPTLSPTNPTQMPTSITNSPTILTHSPTITSNNPTNSPTKYPTTSNPTTTPTKVPSMGPNFSPTVSPIKRPTNSPTTSNPTKSPTFVPTKNPTINPTKKPTNVPTLRPTNDPTNEPTPYPTPYPTKPPTKKPSRNPTRYPTPFEMECYSTAGTISGTNDDDLSYVTCGTGYTLVGCSSLSNNNDRDGDWTDNNGRCYAKNGKNGNGARPYAHCCKLPNGCTCTTYTSSKSGTGDDAKAYQSCPSGYDLVGCSAHTSWKDIDGSYLTNNGNTCVAQNGNGGNGVYASARCCTCSSNYYFDCTYVESPNWVGEGQSVTCPSGFELTNCQGHSPWKHWKGSNPYGNSCAAHAEGAGNIKANANCCRIQSG